MEIASILLGLALLTVVGLFVGKPFLTDPTPRRPLTPRQRLVARKATLLNDLRDLDFDHDTNKMPDDVYEFQRAALVKETAVILKQLDSPKDKRSVDDDIESAIARAKRSKAATADDDIEAAVARAKKPTGNKKKSAAGKNVFCANCGKPMDSSDKFCTACGHKK